MPNELKQDQQSTNNEPAVNNTPGMNPDHRHFARRYALQALYQWQLTQTSLTDVETQFVQFQIDKQLDMDYFKAILHGVDAHQAAIDAHIQSPITRPLTEIDAIELAVLRLATYELLHRPDVPYRVIINEALRLTKKFGSVEGYKFVNGVLDKIAKKTRSIEMNIQKKDTPNNDAH